MIVISVLGVVVGMSISGVRGALARERVDGWVRTITYDIAAARQAALTRRTTVTVSITSHAYTVGAADGGTLRQALLPEDIVLSTTCPAAACSFNRRGVPLAAGTITVTNTTTGRTYTVRITQGTGRVSYSEP
ncbi:MAG: GspH/FimT family pseudopilin [Armatimonadota bacterium]|nr:GspH/FimT family pseudopilin [Armatimonadota bacterium]MDR7427646.1 GspH/FimT family pseudopilin [Armatimonadota bacterium]MDR7464297.1 GspH/FimT family pseudopilin [Armatimonadota bacterium]MDR7470165.1 GspH/FimT family pseudopilin [Armatimonadota bacterium]MDR7473593.1 GspH/FimT family pseudopilin [Armatimonadota bacterium]